MKLWIAFWNILVKDMRTYYLKPPNVSWGLIFPLAWTGMFFIKSGSGLGSIDVASRRCLYLHPLWHNFNACSYGDV